MNHDDLLNTFYSWHQCRDGGPFLPGGVVFAENESEAAMKVAERSEFAIAVAVSERGTSAQTGHEAPTALHIFNVRRDAVTLVPA